MEFWLSAPLAYPFVGCTFYGYVSHLLTQQPPDPWTPRTLGSKMEMFPLPNQLFNTSLPFLLH
ncbi:hypothetical protein Fmac_030873 [Flemingia macrophylla]|uniref:Uncharacterized protein n=1 Tax=Flemingia macrophylla TaxID=520843 RepID=A0ABD1L0F3_9FABA